MSETSPPTKRALLDQALSTLARQIDDSPEPRNRVEVSVQTLGTREVLGTAEYVRTEDGGKEWRVSAQLAWNVAQSKDPRVTAKVVRSW